MKGAFALLVGYVQLLGEGDGEDIALHPGHIFCGLEMSGAVKRQVALTISGIFNGKDVAEIFALSFNNLDLGGELHD